MTSKQNPRREEDPWFDRQSNKVCSAASSCRILWAETIMGKSRKAEAVDEGASEEEMVDEDDKRRSKSKKRKEEDDDASDRVRAPQRTLSPCMNMGSWLMKHYDLHTILPIGCDILQYPVSHSLLIVCQNQDSIALST
jgi:hypothetical protein